MITWVLILTLTIGGKGAAITYIPDFKTQAECQAAGKAWAETADNDLNRWTQFSTICIGKTK